MKNKWGKPHPRDIVVEVTKEQRLKENLKSNQRERKKGVLLLMESQ